MKTNRIILILFFINIVAMFIGFTDPNGGASSNASGFSDTKGTIIEDWSLSPYQLAGTYADNIGSKIDSMLEDGPDGRKAVKLTATLVTGGWCGISRGNSADLSRKTFFKFKIRTSVPGHVQMALRDKYNVQYTVRLSISSKSWTEITVPFSSFRKDAYYTPPGARVGHLMDLTWTRAISFMPQIVGDSVIEIGTIEAGGTGGAFFDRANETEEAGSRIRTVKISRSGGKPISPFMFGNCYFDWVDWDKNGRDGFRGSEEVVKALGLNVIVAANNLNDANHMALFDRAQEDKFIEYCRAVGAEPIMIIPVYGNNIDGGPMSAQIAADIVTYVNGTKKYGVKYWSIGCEVDIYDLFFKRKTGLPVSNVSEYAAVYKSYAKAMLAANAAAHSGVEIKFVGPELGGRFSEGDDWLSPMLDECKDYIDVVSIHSYAGSARELCVEEALTDIDQFPSFIRDIKARIAKHARPGTQLAITEANISYDADNNSYTPEARRVGPGTFYAAIWDADRLGSAMEAELWNFSFWQLAEPYWRAKYTPFGFVLTDPSKNPPVVYKLTPEYYAQQMVATNFSGTSVKPSGAPARMSVYASYDAKKAVTTVLVINKNTVERILTLAVDTLEPVTATFSPMSINIVKIPDAAPATYQMLEYTMQMADAGLPPKAKH